MSFRIMSCSVIKWVISNSKFCRNYLTHFLTFPSSHRITLHHITSYLVISYHIKSHHITSHHITSHHITFYHIQSYSIIINHILSSLILPSHPLPSSILPSPILPSPPLSYPPPPSSQTREGSCQWQTTDPIPTGANSSSPTLRSRTSTTSTQSSVR